MIRFDIIYTTVIFLLLIIQSILVNKKIVIRNERIIKRPKFHLHSSRSNEKNSRKEDEYYFLIEKDNSKGEVKTNVYIYIMK